MRFSYPNRQRCVVACFYSETMHCFSFFFFCSRKASRKTRLAMRHYAVGHSRRICRHFSLEHGEDSTYRRRNANDINCATRTDFACWLESLRYLLIYSVSPGLPIVSVLCIYNSFSASSYDRCISFQSTQPGHWYARENTNRQRSLEAIAYWLLEVSCICCADNWSEL